MTTAEKYVAGINKLLAEITEMSIERQTIDQCDFLHDLCTHYYRFPDESVLAVSIDPVLYTINYGVGA